MKKHRNITIHSQNYKVTMSTIKKPKGHYISVGIIIGIGIFGMLGTVIYLITNNFAFIGVGPAVGIPIGLILGQSIESKKEREGKIRELSTQEKQRQHLLIFLGLGVAFLSIIGFLLFAIVQS